MQRRLILIAIVFVAGFGIGYGITWLFVGSPERAEAPRVAEGSGAGDGERRGERRRRDAGEAPGESPTGGGASQGEATAAKAPADVAQEPSEVAPEPVQGGGGPAPAPVDAAVVEPTVAEPTPSEPAPSVPASWERCLQKVCRIDFKGVSGGISVRKGKLEHGQEIVWDRDFGRADKVGTLDSGRDVKVEVLAIGLTNGEPAAAYISRKVRRGTQLGVVALRIGERRLELVPLD